MIANFPLIFVVAGDNPANNVKELVEWAKAHPDKANYPSTSPAFTITSELFKLKSGMPGVMIPYKGSNEMILSVIDGQSLFAFPDGPPTVPQVKAGKLKALAVTGAERSSQLPDTPSMSEAGYPDVDVHLWSGVFAPTGTPAPIVAKLSSGVEPGDPRPRRVGQAQGHGGQSGRPVRRRIQTPDRSRNRQIFRGGQSRELAFRGMICGFTDRTRPAQICAPVLESWR